MGIAYYPKKELPDEHRPNVNFCGADLIGFLFKTAGLRIIPARVIPGEEDFELAPRIPYEAEEAECIVMGMQLETFVNDHPEKLIETCKKWKFLWADAPEEVIDWLKELWIPFLKNCGGYDSC